MISVCLALYNGQDFIKSQLNSILLQLSSEDEIIVVNDCSTDESRKIVSDFDDKRIRIIDNARNLGVVKTFEQSLRNAKGDYIFLSDQDDVWLPGRVEKMVRELQDNDLVVSNAVIINADNLFTDDPDFFSIRKSKSGFLKNFYKNSFLGCAMAFRSRVLDWVLPFPDDLPMHDEWIGLNVELYGRTVFVSDILTLYRRHDENVSSMKPHPMSGIISKRYRILRSLITTFNWLKPKPKPKPKILIYATNYFPEPTGSGFYTGEMASWIENQGYEVEVITASPHYPHWKIADRYRPQRFLTERINGVKVFRVPIYLARNNPSSSVNRIISEISFSFLSLKYWIPILLSHRKYDLVIAICPPLQLGVLPVMYKKIRGVFFILHVQDLQVDAANDLGMIRSKALIKALFFMERKIMQSASSVTSITLNMCKRIESKGIDSSKIVLFPNWSDISHIKESERENDFRRNANICKEDMLFIYSGNMGEKQGLEVVLLAASALSKYNKAIKFLLIGEGSAKAGLIKMAVELNLENVQFMPVQSYETLPRLLASADVHLIVQKSEAGDLVMPSKLTNIMAAGRPCIATALPDTALYSTIIQYQTGLVCPPDNSDDLAEAIKILASDSGLRKQMGKNARFFAESFLDKDAILSDFGDLIRRLRSKKSNQQEVTK